MSVGIPFIMRMYLITGKERIMNTASLRTQLHFSVVVLAPFALALVLVSLLLGCGGKEPEQPAVAKPEVTLENLQTAYSKATRHMDMYRQFAKQAEKEKLPVIANLYRAAARSEEIHAAHHANLLKSQGIEPQMPTIEPVVVGTTIQTLKMALSSEGIEAESMYPNLVRTATLEKFEEAGRQFELCRDGDLRQQELFREAHDRALKVGKVAYWVCPGCGYIITSDAMEECPLCTTKKEKFEKV